MNNKKETILNKIINQIKVDEQTLFDSFNPSLYSLNRKRKIYYPKLKDFLFIAESKKASPSRGILKENYNSVSITQKYQQAGVHAVSIITEKNFFLGSKSDLINASLHLKLPILRKDFIFHPYQIYESFNMNADIILLILAILDKNKFELLADTALALNMSILIETHSQEELILAENFYSRYQKKNIKGQILIGINNRNLHTFKANLNHCINLKKTISNQLPIIAESGIFTIEDIKKLKEHNFSGVLIGEALLKSKDTISKINSLIHSS